MRVFGHGHLNVYCVAPAVSHTLDDGRRLREPIPARTRPSFRPLKDGARTQRALRALGRSSWRAAAFLAPDLILDLLIALAIVHLREDTRKNSMKNLSYRGNHESHSWMCMDESRQTNTSSYSSDDGENQR